MVKKKLLTIDDLVKFCEEHNFSKFSAKESGYQLAVQVPTMFEVEDSSDDNHRGMLKLKFRILHDGLNRNGSFVSHQAADKASVTIADRPILAAIHQLDDGTWDFKSHEMEVIKNEDGEDETVYIEKQVGSFSSEKPFWEHDDELDKNYLCAYGYIAEEYTKAADIIRNKGGWTKNSSELAIEELAYNMKEKAIDLKAFYVSGSTLLGKKDDGTEIGEGMLGSRADIVDFSEKNNSIFSQNEEVIKLLSELNEKIDGLNIETSYKEGGNKPLFEELLKKYSKTVEEIDFEYEGLSDEELEALFAEHFEDTPKKKKKGEDDDVTPSGEGDDSGDDDKDDDDQDDDESDDQQDELDQNDQPDQNVNQETGYDANNANNDASDGEQEEVNYYSMTITKGDETKTFAVSLNDKIEALYSLVNNTYADADGDFYDVIVYDDSKEVVMRGYWSGRAYRQSYKVKKNNYTLVDERVEVKAIYVTPEEEKTLDAMKANYSSIESELASFKAEPEKQEVLSEECYAQIANTEAYKKLAEQDTHFTMSVDEVRAELDKQLLEYAKGHEIKFAAKDTEKKSVGIKLFGNPAKKAGSKSGRYGGLFSKDS